jgi:surface protein
MEGMFANASSFNGDVSGWDTRLVFTMRGMFAGASSFDQSLGDWDISMVGDMENMLNGWADIQQAKQSNVALGAVGLYFSNDGSSARSELRCGSGWQIIDEGNQSVAPGSLRAVSQLVTIVC